MNDYMGNSKRTGTDVKDIMILKGLASGKSLRQIQADILAKSHNTVEIRIKRMVEDGLIKPHEYYSRDWILTDLGREELRKYNS